MVVGKISWSKGLTLESFRHRTDAIPLIEGAGE